MKLTAFILLVFCLQLSAKTGAQEKITLKEKGASLSKILTEIQKQTGHSFFLSEETIKNSKPIDIEVKNATLKEVLDVCFKNQPFTYHINQNAITIIPKKNQNNDSKTGEQYSKILIDVKGRVVDEKEDPVSGATVSVQGTSKSTITNDDGIFSLSGVEDAAVLSITHVQYNTLTIKLNGRSFILGKLQVKVSPLDEMQVIAYGTTTRRFTTGNVATVKSTDIEKQPVNNPLLALAGRVPGLFITQSTGLPGSGITVSIQGQNSINGGNDPLYVIDGIPFISQTLATATVGEILQNSGSSNYQKGGYGNPLSFINPNDIESIEVLKDADATSIYGSRAANGAILITTKKGKTGPPKLDVNFQQGWGKVTKTLEMMNTEQYLEMRMEALVNDGLSPNPRSDYDLTLWDQSRYTNWVKTLIGGTSKFSNINASITGGSTNAKYLVGATYRNEKAIFGGNFNDRKVGLHFSINSNSSNQKFHLQLTGNLLTDKNLLPRGDLTPAAYSLSPNAPNLLNEDGTLNWAPDALGNSSWINPLSRLFNKYENKSDNLTSNAVLSYLFFPGFEVSSRFGYTKLQTDEFSATTVLSARPERRASFVRGAQYSNNSVKIFLVEPQVNYKREWGKLKFNGMVGVTIQQNISYGENISGSGYATDDLTKDIRSATKITVNSTIDGNYKYNALFGTLNANWKNKYLVNLNGRRDGSSHFGPANRFNNFASVGVAWIFSEEHLLRNSLSFLSFGKIKTSYGTSGNDQIGDYTFMDLYNSTNPAVAYQNSPSIIVTRLPSPYLQWEETRKLSIGLDLGFLHDRIFVNASYNRNRSSNQLMNYALPSIAGFESIDRNFPATVQNISWEFAINTVNVKAAGIEWKTNINLTIPKNSLVEFPGIESTSYESLLKIGFPTNVFLAYKFAGVNSNTGIYQFVDRNGELTSSPTLLDRTVLIDINPKFYGGLQNTLRLKNAELDVFFQFVKKIGPSRAFGVGFPPGVANTAQPAFLLDRWQKPDDTRSIQKYNSDYSLYEQYSNADLSDAGYIDASFIRLKNVSVSYEIPLKHLQYLHFRYCKLFMQGQNLVTITNYKGVDPENASFSLAPLKIWTAGLQLGL